MQTNNNTEKKSEIWTARGQERNSSFSFQGSSLGTPCTGGSRLQRELCEAGASEQGHQFKPCAVYAAAWRQTGPGLLIALMFVIIASAAMLRDQSAANASNINRSPELPIEQRLSNLLSGPGNSVFNTVRLELPIAQLRDADGQMTSNGKTLFMLRGRRAKSLSLNITLTTNSIQDAEFAAVIAARMMSDVSLKSEQLRIGVEEQQTDMNSVRESMLTVTITMCAAIDGEVE